MHEVIKGNTTNSEIVLEITGDNGALAIVRLNLIDRANSYTTAMLHLLEQKIKTIVEGNTVRALIITGEGQKSFCAGADKDELKRRRILDGLFLKSRELFDLIAGLPILTIAAINGAAVGGGLELALACDVRVCSPTSQFFFPELSFGLSPAAGGMIRLPDLIGKGRAKEMILCGRKLDAATALDWGLVSFVGEDVVTQAFEIAKCGLAQDPIALNLAKKVIDADQSPGRQDLSAVVQALLYERCFQKR